MSTFPGVEFDCAGCGDHVFRVDASAPPANRLCATCNWAEVFIANPEDRAAFLRFVIWDVSRADRESAVLEVKFACAGCGRLAHSVGGEKPPTNRLCSMCGRVEEFIAAAAEDLPPW